MVPVKQYVKDEFGQVHEITVAATVGKKRKDGTVRLSRPKAGDPVKAGYKGPPAGAPESAPAAAK